MKILKLLNYVVLFVLIILNIAQFYTNHYLLEIITSVTPYLFLASLFLFILQLLYFVRNRKLASIEHFKKLKIFCLLFLLNITFLLVSGTKIVSFSFVKPVSAGTTGKELKISFFNTLYTNNNFDAISSEIRSSNADILGLAELNPDRVKKIEALKEYPYSISDTNFRGKDIGIFSKYPITELSGLDSDTDFFISGEVVIDTKPYTIIVAHPVPPLNEYWHSLRSIVLNKLTDRIGKPDQTSTILMGDFNLTPWSPTYRNFTGKLSGMKNTSAGAGLNFTWHESGINLQIDHIFVPKEFCVDSYQVLGRAGSDHKMISSTIILQ